MILVQRDNLDVIWIGPIDQKIAVNVDKLNREQVCRARNNRLNIFISDCSERV